MSVTSPSGARFLTEGVYECDIIIGCNPMHPPTWKACASADNNSLVAHWHTYAPPHCRTSQYSKTFILLSVSLWNDHADPKFDGVGLAGFKSRAITFLLA